jgi:hypothetical protein
MNVPFKIRLLAYIAFAVLVGLAVVGYVCGDTRGNVKVDLTEERAGVSCVDGENPTVRLTPRPEKGYYVIVVCERSK